MKFDIEAINEVYQKLQDDESRMVFNFRMNLWMGMSYQDMVEEVINMNHKWNIIPEDDCLKRIDGREVIIFGAGVDGEMTKLILDQKGIKTSYFCDNDLNKCNKNLSGVPVIQATEAIKNHGNAFIILASAYRAASMYSQLISYHFSRDNIFYPTIGRLIAKSGEQYFDCPNFEHSQNEVFIDAGCYNGNDSRLFAKWTNESYKKIIAFEPDIDNYKLIMQDCKDIKSFTVNHMALWNEHSTLKFDNTSESNSHVDDNGNECVLGEALDNIVVDDIPTFIKMDIEGAELEALRGAKRTISEYKPKLAICVYHKPWDIVELPQYILSLRSDYHLYLRHYTNSDYETVLYAV